jgi:hypothetical protein
VRIVYDLSLGLGWLPRDVRELTVEDLEGLTKAAHRREARSKRGK